MSTQVDAVILALTAKWQALAVPAGTLEGVRVVDGPQATMDASSEWLFVGFDGGGPADISQAATAEQTLMAFLKTQQEEAEIQCAVVVVRGDTDITSARQRGFSIVAAAETALRNDMLLGGLVMHSFISGTAYIPQQTDSGAKARIVFTVTYQAQI